MKNYILGLLLLGTVIPINGQSIFSSIDNLMDNGSLDQALIQLEKIVKEGSDQYKAKALRRIGSIQREQSDYTLAIQSLQEAEAIWLRINPEEEELPKIYYSLAVIYSEIGDVEKAKDKLDQQIRLASKLYGENHELIGDAYLQMTKVGYQLQDWDLALQGALKVLKIYQSIFEKDHIKIGNAYNNAGLIYELGKQDYQKALSFYEKALRIKKKHLGNDHPSTTKTLINIAYIYRQAKNFPKAIQLYKKNLSVLRNRYDEKQTDVAVAYYTLASTYLEMEQADSALFYAQKAIISAHPTFDDLDYNKQPNTIETIVTDYLIDILGIKGEALALRFSKDKNPVDLDASLAAYDAALNIALQIRDYFRSSDESKLVLQEYLYPLYENALQAAFNAWENSEDQKYLAKAFRYIEQSKSLLLNQAFRQTQVSTITEIPTRVMERGQQFQADLLNTSQEESSLIKVKKEYDDWLQEIKQTYPKYYELSYGYDIIELEEVQKNLSTQQSMINYFEGDDTIFAIVINSNGSKLYKISKKDGFEESVQALRSGITDYYIGESPVEWNEYEEITKLHSKKLFQQLIQPFHQINGKLIIIPDGLISYIPFDVLMDSSEQLLIEEKSISFAYSATLLDEMQKQRKRSKVNWLGVAPGFMDIPKEQDLAFRNGFSPLPFSKKEVEAIQQITNGKALLGKEAKLKIFLENSSQFNCIHLSSHSRFSDDDPSKSFIAFSDTLLYAKDLYAHKIPADLVVLSACETNMGSIQKGEGIMSIGRAFTYAGARSLLTTLWPVKDGTTAAFMELFYENLQKGLEKDEALRQTKLHFIENQETPFFWAAYTLNGDMAAMPLNSKNFPWHILLGMTGIIGFVLASRKIFKKN